MTSAPSPCAPIYLMHGMWCTGDTLQGLAEPLWAAGFRVEGRFVLNGEAAAIAPHAFRGSRVGSLDMDSWTLIFPSGSVERLEANAFSGLVHVDATVDLSEKGLVFVGTGAFSNLTRSPGADAAEFSTVDLSDNAIASVEAGAFATLRAGDLDLSGNNLTRVVTGAFRDLELSADVNGLLPGVKYTLQVEGCMASDPTVCGRARVDVGLVDEPLRSSIVGGDLKEASRYGPRGVTVLYGGLISGSCVAEARRSTACSQHRTKLAGPGGGLSVETALR